jgi:hypothetical protein
MSSSISGWPRPSSSIRVRGGAGHRVGGVGLAQHGLHAQGVAAAGQAQDAALTALVAALQPHHARAHRVGGVAAVVGAVEALARLQPDVGDVHVDAVQRRVVQNAEQREPAHPAFGADLGLRVEERGLEWDDRGGGHG